jgi:PAS domain S-box-containing protein
MTKATIAAPLLVPVDLPRILIVDDDREVSALLAARLEKGGCQVEIVSDANQVWGALERIQPDLVLIDVMLPGEDGVSLAATVRATERFRDLPIIFLTSHHDPSTLLVSRDWPEAEFIRKPVNDGYLRAHVMARIALARAVRELTHFKSALDEHAIVSMTDASGRITYVNSKFCEVSGYSREELIGKTHRIVKSGQHPAALYDEMWGAISTGKVWQGELRNRTKGGCCYWVETTIVPVLDHFGLPEAYISIRTEVTKLKETEEALRRSEALFRDAFMEAPIGVVLKNLNGKFLRVNHAFEQLTGYGEAELLGKDCTLLTHPDDFPVVPSAKSGAPPNALRSDKSERRYLRKDGEVVWVEVSESVLHHQLDAPRLVIMHVNDITRRKQAEEEMCSARDQAERASRAKSEFLSSMSHELRTPLNAVLGFAQLLQVQTRPHADASQKESLEQILKAGWHLLELINEVLDLSKIEAGGLSLSVENVDLAQVVRDCESFVAPLAASAFVRVRIDLASFGVVCVQADQVRLRQALLNLLSNAVKYNRHGGMVTVSARLLSEGFVRIAVSDTGRGLSSVQLRNLFQPFSRLGQEAGAVQGTGIGLAISKRLVETMGGQIGVESAEGSGSTFWIDMPIGGPRATESELVAVPSGACRPVVGNAEQGTVLYIEDNRANLRLVERILGRFPGVRLITACDGESGIEAARAQRPDMILLDINLPGIDGFEVRRRLGTIPETEHIPVVALSAAALPADVQRALSGGFKEYLVKPIRVPQLMDLVAHYLTVSA